MEASIDTIDQVRATLVDLALRFGPKVLAASLILTLGFFVGRWICRWLDKVLMRLELDLPIRGLIVRAVRVLIMLLFMIMALQNLGVELLPLIAGLSVVGAGIALAMQGVLGNVVAGLTIILTRPFRVGEYIDIVGEEGMVENVSLFQTTLLHPDRSKVIIPNRKIVGEILHNFGTIRQLKIVVGVAYDTDVNRAVTVARRVLQGNPRVVKDLEPVIRIEKLGESSVDILVRPWVSTSEFGIASGEINKALLEAFRDSGIVIPFPQREVRLLNEAA